MKQISKRASFFTFPTLVFLLHLIASKILNLYRPFPHLDIPFHYMGGFSIAYASAQILSYLEKEKITTRLDAGIVMVLILSITATAAVFWEFAEFVGDQLFQTNIQISLANTMQDQFLGVLGGLTGVFFYWRLYRSAGLSQRITKKG